MVKVAMVFVSIFLFGFLAVGLPITNWIVSSIKKTKRVSRAYLFSFLSLCSGILSLYSYLIYNHLFVLDSNWAGLQDTTATGVRVAGMFVIAVIGLNLISLVLQLFRLKKSS